MPYTIVHSTQFFEFLGGIAQTATDGDTVRLSPAYFQPISADDVATALTGLALDAPANDTIEIAGPDKFRMSELVQQYLSAKQDPRKVIADPRARYFGAELNDRSLARTRRKRASCRYVLRCVARQSGKGGR